MTVFTAEQLDLSRLPPFRLVAVDYDAETAALKAGVVARFNARGVPYDVDRIETDPAMIWSEEAALRKTETLAAINDAGKRLSLTYGYGEALDHTAATYYADLGLRRLVLREADPVAGTPAVMEDDERFKLRILLAPQARTPGTLGGYEYQALTAAPWLSDALALNYASGLCNPGQIIVVVLGRDPDPDPAAARPAEEEPAQLVLARNAILDRNTKLGSDMVSVRAADRVPVVRGYTLGIRPGPDPALTRAQAASGYGAYLASRRRIGKALAESGEKAALFASGVEYVHPQAGTTGDVVPPATGIVVPTLTLTAEIVGG